MTRPLAVSLAWALTAWNFAALLGFAMSPLFTTVSAPTGLLVGAIAYAFVRRRTLALETTPEAAPVRHGMMGSPTR